MQENLLLLGKSALVLLCAYGASFAAVTLLRKRRQTPVPPENARIRLRADGGMYRTRFLGMRDGRWELVAPLQRDRYVPLRIGETMTVEATMPDGVLLFRSEVVGRDAETATLAIRAPEQVRVTNRRTAPRLDALATGTLNGHAVEVLNVSSCGARIRGNQPLAPGDTVSFECGELEEPVEAVVLEADHYGPTTDLRVRFVFPVSLLR